MRGDCGFCKIPGMVTMARCLGRIAVSRLYADEEVGCYYDHTNNRSLILFKQSNDQSAGMC